MEHLEGHDGLKHHAMDALGLVAGVVISAIVFLAVAGVAIGLNHILIFVIEKFSVQPETAMFLLNIKKLILWFDCFLFGILLLKELKSATRNLWKH